MLREKLAEHHAHKPHEFRWRSREIVRMEGLSDAVFGFAVTLKAAGELTDSEAAAL